MRKTEYRKILVTFAGGRLGMGITRALRAAGNVHLIGVDADEYGIFRAEVDERYLVPRATDPSYMAIIRDLIDRTDADFIWPVHDDEILLMAAAGASLGAVTFLPRPAVVELCQDKLASYRVWVDAGVPVPETILVHDEDDLGAAFAELGPMVWLRAIRGTSGHGALFTDNLTLAKIWIDNFKGWGNFTVAEMLGDVGYSCEMVWQEGRLVASQGHLRRSNPLRRTGMLGSSGPGGTGTRRNCRVPDEVMDVAMRAVMAVSDGRPHGVMSVDMRLDLDGGPRVTEINAGRLLSSNAMLFHEHGFNLPDLILKVACGQAPAGDKPLIDPLPEDVAISLGVSVNPTAVHDADRMRLISELQERIARLGAS